MTHQALKLRLIQPEDNAQVQDLITETLQEFGAVGPGFASSDPEVLDMYGSYQGDDRRYFVLEGDGKIWGGAGVGPLKGNQDVTCELQKMYFNPEIRGAGWGRKMIDVCLQSANEMGYQKCYLETLPDMKAAQHLYASFGFSYISERKGDTGHSGCHVFMMKTL